MFNGRPTPRDQTGCFNLAGAKVSVKVPHLSKCSEQRALSTAVWSTDKNVGARPHLQRSDETVSTSSWSLFKLAQFKSEFTQASGFAIWTRKVDSLTSNVRSLIKMSPLGVARGVCSNLQKSSNVNRRPSSWREPKKKKKMLMKKKWDLLNDVIPVGNLTTSRHKDEFLSGLWFWGDENEAKKKIS